MSSTETPTSTRTDLMLALGAALLTAFVILPVARQGLSLLDDGVWLVGAEQILKGNTLYRDVFTIYGPGKFSVLALFFAVFGTSATTMALTEAVGLGVAAGAGTFAARRSGAGWFALAVPLLVLSLGVLKLKIVWAATMALLWGLGLRRGLDVRSALLLGLGWGSVTWFGLDAAVNAGAVVVGTLVVARLSGTCPVPRVGLTFFGTAIGAFLVPFAWALATGSLSDFVWATYVYPLVHFRAEMSVPLLSTLSDTAVIGKPFATLLTGESLDAVLPAHETIRATSLRVLCVAVFVVPLLAIVTTLRRGRDPLVLALGIFGASSLLSLTTRGDEPHLLGTALATAWLLAAAVGAARAPVRMAAGALMIVGFVPLLAETAWLATHVEREGVSRWERDRAGIVLRDDRIASLENTYGTMAAEARVPTVFWPYQPGLNFVFDLPLGSPQITLLGGEIRDEQALIDQLEDEPPRRMILVRRFDIGGRGMRELAPDLWHYVRTNYRVEDTVTGTEDPGWVLRPVYEGWAVVQRLPLSKRLPDRLQSTMDSWSPQLTGGTRVAQTFRVGQADLSGLQVRWLTLTSPITVPVEIIVWSVENGRLVEPLHGLRSEVSFNGPNKDSVFSFDPIPGTRGREVAVELRIPPEVEYPVHVMWHSQDEDGAVDLFPEGTALVDGEPVAADLYFATY